MARCIFLGRGDRTGMVLYQTVPLSVFAVMIETSEYSPCLSRVQKLSILFVVLLQMLFKVSICEISIEKIIIIKFLTINSS